MAEEKVVAPITMAPAASRRKVFVHEVFMSVPHRSRNKAKN
jgi:hypothetical protein